MKVKGKIVLDNGSDYFFADDKHYGFTPYMENIMKSATLLAIDFKVKVKVIRLLNNYKEEILSSINFNRFINY